MTFNDNARSGGGRVSRRGRNTGFAVGGGGIGLIAIFLISQALGVDLSGLVGGGTAGSTAGDTTLENCDTGADANANLECRIDFAAQSLDGYWETELGTAYTPPPLVLFEQGTNTGCGSATSAVGPFYCPTDQTVYLDVGFYDELRTRLTRMPVTCPDVCHRPRIRPPHPEPPGDDELHRTWRHRPDIRRRPPGVAGRLLRRRLGG
jgi:predicted metalloprotease